MNPPEWTREEALEFPASTDGPWGHALADPWGGQGVRDPEEGWTPRDIYEADRSVRLATEAAKRAKG